MKFFVPGAPNAAVANELYAIWAHACQVPSTHPRLYRIEVDRNHSIQIFEVGQFAPGYPDAIILALFHNPIENRYIAFAPGHGASVQNDVGPISINGVIKAIEYFESPEE
jgi:hypothetical protein